MDSLKTVIREAVNKARNDGFGGIDIEVTICDGHIQEIKEWLVDEIGAFNIIDWQRDDKYGFGIGRNMNRAYCSGISFDFNQETTVISGVVCNVCKQTLPPHTCKQHLDMTFMASFHPCRLPGAAARSD